MELDPFDRQLLELMQADAGRTADELAELVGLSGSAVQRRLKRLRENGVIVRDISLVAPEAVGRPTFFVVGIEVESERQDQLQKLREWLDREKAVQQIYYVTGEADFVVVMTAADTECFDGIMMRLVKENPNVKRFRTNVVLSVVKRSLAIPVPPSA
jgi:Lrp/AsnC family leucine-responsive transcriptional regulator